MREAVRTARVQQPADCRIRGINNVVRAVSETTSAQASLRVQKQVAYLTWVLIAIAILTLLLATRSQSTSRGSPHTQGSSAIRAGRQGSLASKEIVARASHTEPGHCRPVGGSRPKREFT